MIRYNFNVKFVYESGLQLLKSILLHKYKYVKFTKMLNYLKNTFRSSLCLFLLPVLSTLSQSGGKNLFNGSNFSGWYIFLEKRLNNVDPNKVFSLENNILHISGKEVGYLCTVQSYQNYKLIAEFRWANNTGTSLDKTKNKGGIIYHVPLSTLDEAWPQGISYQIQYGASGDVLVPDGIIMTTKHKTTHSYQGTHIYKSSDCERPVGEWNSIEIISNNGKCSHILNGMVVNEITNVSQKSGKILIKSNGSEIFFKNIYLTVL